MRTAAITHAKVLQILKDPSQMTNWAPKMTFSLLSFQTTGVKWWKLLWRWKTPRLVVDPPHTSSLNDFLLKWNWVCVSLSKSPTRPISLTRDVKHASIKAVIGAEAFGTRSFFSWMKEESLQLRDEMNLMELKCNCGLKFKMLQTFLEENIVNLSYVNDR